MTPLVSMMRLRELAGWWQKTASRNSTKFLWQTDLDIFSSFIPANISPLQLFKQHQGLKHQIFNSSRSLYFIASMNSTAATAAGVAGFSEVVPPPYDLVPSVLQYPFYHTQAPSILSWISDKELSLLAPIAVYWAASLFFEGLDAAQIPFLEKYRIHEPEEVKKRNRVSRTTVFLAVIVQQIVQTFLGLYWLDAEDHGPASGKAHRAAMAVYGAWISRIAFALLGPAKGSQLLRWKGQEMVSFAYWWAVPVAQFLWASFVLDTWQYFWHRYFHTNRFLYKHIHSLHHRLYCPYAYGALYNHPVEGFLFDSLGTVIAHAASFMTTRQAILLFSFSTLKTVDDHCGCESPANTHTGTPS